jgi:hypothetical protein
MSNAAANDARVRDALRWCASDLPPPLPLPSSETLEKSDMSPRLEPSESRSCWWCPPDGTAWLRAIASYSAWLKLDIWGGQCAVGRVHACKIAIEWVSYRRKEPLTVQSLHMGTLQPVESSANTLSALKRLSSITNARTLSRCAS